jgi:hypothetical protein
LERDFSTILRIFQRYLLYLPCSTPSSDSLASLLCADGFYQWDKGQVQYDGFCCQRPVEDPEVSNWKTHDVLKELNSLDPNWRKYLGWIPFFNVSLELSDLRIEYDNLHNVADCTHFIYTPLAYERLWRDTRIAITSLAAAEHRQQEPHISVS